MIEKTLAELTLNITDGKHGDCRGKDDSGFYFISCKDVIDGQIHYEDARQIIEEDFLDAHKRTRLEPDDILVTNSGTIGRMAFIRDVPLTYRTTFQKSVAIVKPDKSKILPKYLYYQLQNCVDGFVNRSNGAAQKNLLLSTMRAFRMHIHEDADMQMRIASTLSAYDDLIENNQKQIKLLEKAAQRLYKEWFVDLRFPGYETTPIVDGIPEGWEKNLLGGICTLKKDTVPAGQISTETPYIGLEHMPRVDFCLSSWGSAADVSSNKFRYAEDDIIFGKIRPYFHKVGFALNNGVVSTDSFVMKANNGIWGLLLMTVFDRTFVDYTYQTCKEGAKMPRADWKQMEKYPVLIPNEKIRQDFEKFIWNITRQVKTLALQNRALAEARDRLLPKLMSGEIEV